MFNSSKPINLFPETDFPSAHEVMPWHVERQGYFKDINQIYCWGNIMEKIGLMLPVPDLKSESLPWTLAFRSRPKLAF